MVDIAILAGIETEFCTQACIKIEVGTNFKAGTVAAIATHT